MGCIQGVGESSNSPSNNKTHHQRCCTNEQQSDNELTLSAADTNNTNKPQQINTDISILAEDCDKKSMLRKRMYTYSNSIQSFTKQSIISNSTTTTTAIIANTTPTHVSYHNNRIILPNYYTIDEDQEDVNMDVISSCKSSPNNSPMTSPLPTILDLSQLTVDEIDELNQYKRTFMFPYRNRAQTLKLKRSKSHDPNKQIQLQASRGLKLSKGPSKYAYNNSKNGEINTSKKKRRLVHAKSKSIPQNIFSSDLSRYQTQETNNYQYLAQITHFDENTLRLLHLRFKYIHKIYRKLQRSSNTDLEVENNINSHERNNNINTNINIKLDINAIATIFGLPSDCILVKRLFDYMDEHKMGQLSFRVFARTMSILSNKACINEKCELSFALYDLNNDGVIHKNELKILINDLLLKGNASFHPLLIKLINDNAETFVDTLIENTMKLFDLDCNGNITYESYFDFISKGNQRLLSPFTVDIEKLLDFEAEKRRMKRISLNSLNKMKLRQMIIGADPKRKYNKKWKKPKFIKDLEKDKIQHVNSIKNPNEICLDLFEIHNQINDKYTLNQVNEQDSNSNSNDSEIDEIDEMEKKEKLKQERMQRTIDFLYDD